MSSPPPVTFVLLAALLRAGCGEGQERLSTLRFVLIHQPARLVRPAGRLQLRFAVSPRARSHIERCQGAIERLAA